MRLRGTLLFTLLPLAACVAGSADLESPSVIRVRVQDLAPGAAWVVLSEVNGSYLASQRTGPDGAARFEQVGSAMVTVVPVDPSNTTLRSAIVAPGPDVVFGEAPVPLKYPEAVGSLRVRWPPPPSGGTVDVGLNCSLGGSREPDGFWRFTLGPDCLGRPVVLVESGGGGPSFSAYGAITIDSLDAREVALDAWTVPEPSMVRFQHVVGDRLLIGAFARLEHHGSQFALGSAENPGDSLPLLVPQGDAFNVFINAAAELEGAVVTYDLPAARSSEPGFSVDLDPRAPVARQLELSAHSARWDWEWLSESRDPADLTVGLTSPGFLWWVVGDSEVLTSVEFPDLSPVLAPSSGFLAPDFSTINVVALRRVHGLPRGALVPGASALSQTRSWSPRTPAGP